ncbi:MAG: alpha/beta hydrolase [Oxalobacteraceae bacterium]|jgi:pimeloyl-ACP methyl ester carboxylesterase|nr:alpha/beta hydrolase [Oxalobacteraceae bacterium]
MHAELRWKERDIRIEYRWVGNASSTAPVMVFLHEGLGSVALWKDFPDTLCQRLHMRGLVYSRPGYGSSTPRDSDEHWGTDFMHQQAWEVLPALLSTLNINKPWLFGHSDGGSIALLYASRFAHECAGAVVVAPHIMVEDISISSIGLAREAYQYQGLREKLTRYHDDVDSAFFGWNNVWLNPTFRDWSIESSLSSITCPLLAIQGEQDEYGTLRQITGIQEHLPHTVIVALPECGHSPHRDQPEALIRAVTKFITTY